MTRTAAALAVALTLAACAPEFALQRPTSIRCDCLCDRKPCTLQCPAPEPTLAPKPHLTVR